MMGVSFIELFVLLMVVPIGAIVLRLAIAILNKFLPKYVPPDMPGESVSEPLIVDSATAEGLPERDLSNPFSAPVEIAEATDPYAIQSANQRRGTGAIPKISFLRAMWLILIYVLGYTALSLSRSMFIRFDFMPIWLMSTVYYVSVVAFPAVLAWRAIPTTFYVASEFRLSVTRL